MWDYIMYVYGDQVMALLFMIVFAVIGYIAQKIWKKALENKEIAEIADTVVLYVEQAWKDLHGEDKLNKALEAGADLLSQKGIKLTTNQLKVYIEAALAGFNNAFNTNA